MVDWGDVNINALEEILEVIVLNVKGLMQDCSNSKASIH